MNEVETGLAGDDAVVYEVVRQYIPRFAAHGFEFTGVTVEGSPKLNSFLVFRFLNKRTGMRIDISFFAATRGLNGGFTVLMIKPVNQKLDVEDYLKAHGREELSEYFRYRDPKADVRGFANSFLQMFCALLDKDLKAVLDGRTFEVTPIDWMGYK